MAENDKTYDVTIYRTDGSTTTHQNVTNDKALELENTAFTDRRVSSVTATQRQR